MPRRTPPEDALFPGLDERLSPELLRCSLQQGLLAGEDGVHVEGTRIRRHYYRPGEFCRVLLEARLRTRLGAERTQIYFGEMHTARDWEAALQRAREQPSSVPVPQAAMVLWAFPHDPYLPGLPVLSDAEAMRYEIQHAPESFGLPVQATVLEVGVRRSKYVPARRCGFHYRVRWRNAAGRDAEHVFFGKAYALGNARKAYDVVRQIQSAPMLDDGRLRVPRVYGYDEALAAVWQESVDGQPQSKCTDLAALERAAPRVARALAALPA